MAKKGKQYSKISGTWEQIKPSYNDLEDVPSTFTPTSHTHGNVGNTGLLGGTGVAIATGDHLVIADNSGSDKLEKTTITFDTNSTNTYLRRDGTWATIPAANGLTFQGTISLSGGKNGSDLAAAGLSSTGDYLIVTTAGELVTGGLFEIIVQAPGDESDSTLPVTLEVGDWILYESEDAINQTLTVIILNNNDASKAAAVHTHTIANVTGLQTAIDGKVAKAGDTMTGTLVIGQTDSGNPGAGADNLRVSGFGILGNRGSLYVTNQNTSGDIQFGVGGVHAAATKMKISSNGVVDIGGNTVFHDGYHPNADKLTTARNIALSGAVTGNANFDGSGNISIATTATADPVLTLAGDATGSATFTNLGNATLTVAIVDDSHQHRKITTQDIRNTSNTPNTIESTSIQSFFNNVTIPTGLTSWYSTVSVKGWSDTYAAWELAGNATSSAQDGLFFRYGAGTSWQGWQRVFTDNYHPNADTWTTARTLTIGNTGKSVNGSGNVSWSLAEIGAAPASHTHDDRYFTETESDARFIIKNSGYEWTATGSGALRFRSENVIDTASGSQASLEVYQDNGGEDAFMTFHVSGDYAKYFGLHGGINDFVVGGWSHGASYQRIYHDGYHPNADTWTTARTLTIGNTGKSVNGSGNVSWSLAEIGAYAASNPSGYTTNTGTVTSVATGGGLTGGTITGTGTISHADTSSQASVNNSGNTMIQDITLDTYGHITGITSASVGWTWEQIRARANNATLTSSGTSGSLGGSLTVTGVSLAQGDTIMMEVNDNSSVSAGYTPVIIMFTLGAADSIPTDINQAVGWRTAYANSNLHYHYTFKVGFNSGNVLYFDDAFKFDILDSSTASSVKTTATYTLHIGRIWRLRA